jgi:colanic acid biosynthesis glycosyl transferase WcaI
MNHLSFAASATVASLLVGPVDVVVVESPPLFVGAAGPLIRLPKRAKFVLNVADLWPEAPVAMGMLTHRRAIAMAALLDKALLATADHVVGVTPNIARYVVEGKSVAPSKVSFLPNSVDTHAYGPDVAAADLSEWFPASDFTVLYSGTLSVTHRLTPSSRRRSCSRDTPGSGWSSLGAVPTRRIFATKPVRCVSTM